MFKRFEGFTEPFPKSTPDQPPSGMFAFLRYYTRGYEKPLIIMSLMATIVAVVEVMLFGAWDNWLIGCLPAIQKRSYKTINRI